MKRTAPLILFLIIISSVIYAISILMFHDSRDTLFYLLQDAAFVPIQVLFVTLLLDRLLAGREKIAMLRKLNMVIGVFFSEAGRDLILNFSGFDQNFEALRKIIPVTTGWKDREYDAVYKTMQSWNFTSDSRKFSLLSLKKLLEPKRPFLLGLMENQNLLEHETFTELLLAVFHLMEELSFRKDLSLLSAKDMDHLSVDIQRAYKLLVLEWILYMKHLNQNYPHLHSLAVRMNPFNPKARAEME